MLRVDIHQWLAGGYVVHTVHIHLLLPLPVGLMLGLRLVGGVFSLSPLASMHGASLQQPEGGRAEHIAHASLPVLAADKVSCRMRLRAIVSRVVVSGRATQPRNRALEVSE